MARPASKHPTDGELEILKILWDESPVGLKHICDAIRKNRPVATTTVATILKVMHQKELIIRTRTNSGYVWEPAVAREITAKRIVEKQIDGLFDGSARLLVSHLIEDGKLSNDDFDEIQQLLDKHRKEKKS